MTPPEQLLPQEVMARLVCGSWVSQMLSVAAHLNIADRLKNGPLSAEEIARSAETNPDATYRLMRGLSAVGVLMEHEGERFSLTPVGECLRTDVPGSFAGMAKYIAAGWHGAAWNNLMYSVRTGKDAFTHAHGQGAFEWGASHPGDFAVFYEAMTSISTVSAQAVTAAYDFSTQRQICDVGAGHGLLLSEILKANPQNQGVLFDVPPVIEGAKKLLAEQRVEARCEVRAGDFFKSVPAGCDAYLLKHIIHDWDDTSAVRILKNIAQAMKPQGRVLVIEQVMTPPGIPHQAKVLDLEMLVMTHGGRERTEAEYAQLFSEAGLKFARHLPTRSPVSILEATKA